MLENEAMENIKIIAFDADDTLWENETFFREVEVKYYYLLREYIQEDELAKELYQTEVANIPIYGYGIKGFMLSMIETALRVSKNKVNAQVINEIISLGQAQLNEPVKILSGVKTVLEELQGKYHLVLATKGDLTDQRRKLHLSGLQGYFNHVEIMNEKTIQDYTHLIEFLGCDPTEFLMVGNSLKSDIQPILELGGYAAHIPFHITWEHEKVEKPILNKRFLKLKCLEDLFKYVS